MAQTSIDPKKIAPAKTIQQYNRLVKKGDQLYNTGDFGEALKYYTKAIAFDGYNPNILLSTARSLFKVGLRGQAISLLEHALEQNASNPIICQSLGAAAIDMDLHDIAEKFFMLYCELRPDDPNGYNNLASAYRENGKIDEAIDLLQSILPVFPEHPKLWSTLGAAVNYRDGGEAAQIFHEEALRLDPENSEPMQNLAQLYLGPLAMHKEAEELAKKAISIRPKVAGYHKNLAHIHLIQGNMEEGMKEMAWNNHASDMNSVHMPYQFPWWQGEDLSGKTILVGAEQGIGDEIFFSNLYPALIKEAKHVVIGCDKRLVPLFQNSFKEASVMGYEGGKDAALKMIRYYPDLEGWEGTIDVMCLWNDVMRLRWTSLDKVPAGKNPHLFAPTKKRNIWKKKLAKLPPGLNIGFSWRSGISYARRQMYYARLVEWAPLLKTKNVNFINFQYGDNQKELEELKEKTGITVHTFEGLDLKDDFEDLAAISAELDMFFGPGSAPIALAVATGAPVWWLDFFGSWWSFGQERGTPMYAKGTSTIKPTSQSWEDFMKEFAKGEFKNWVTSALKEKKKKS